MKQIVIGSKENPVALDLPRLLASRLLIQGTSGSGKSRLLRRLIEQAAPLIQCIVIDPEGEFGTLREKHDMVLAGPGGEVSIALKNAKVFARRLMELRTSAVIDLYEIDRHLRMQYVRDFLDALLDIPKDLYHPTLVIIDEAHGLCPEQTGGAITKQSVIDLMDKGRKRGLGTILATQRLSKLDKDAAAECGNIIIGTTSPIDRARAADLLGLHKNDAMQFVRQERGLWTAAGPAMEGEADDFRLYRFTTGEIHTTHPEAGKHHRLAMPAASAAIRKVLPELQDLAQRPDDDPITLDDAQKQIKELRRQLKAKAAPAAPVAVDPKAIERAVSKAVDDRDKHWKNELAKVEKNRTMLIGRLGQIGKLAHLNGQATVEIAAPSPVARSGMDIPKMIQTRTGDRENRVVSPRREKSFTQVSQSGDLPKGEAATLAALIQYPDGLRREQLTVLTGYKRSSRDAYIQRLREKGFVDTSGDRVMATDDGIAALPDAEPLPTGDALQNFWRSRLPEGERVVLDMLIEAYPNAVDRQAIDESTGYKRSSRDAYLQRLLAKQLVTTDRGTARASDNLFEVATA
jgi:uncharacterized protein